MAEVCTSRCQQAKAANTLWVHEGRLHADATDGIGLIRDLSHHMPLAEKKVLVLGAGGAARSIIASLLEANIATLMVVNRTVSRAKALQTDFPLIDCGALEALDSVYDLYKLTPFLSWAQQAPCAASDGLGMLIEQAAEAFRIWHGVMPDTRDLILNLRADLGACSWLDFFRSLNFDLIDARNHGVDDRLLLPLGH